MRAHPLIMFGQNTEFYWTRAYTVIAARALLNIKKIMSSGQSGKTLYSANLGTVELLEFNTPAHTEGAVEEG